MKRTVVALFACALALSGCSQPESEDLTYDIVLAGGRVMDPASGLDAIRNVGVRDGRIAVVTEETLDGTRVIDASGIVVASRRRRVLPGCGRSPVAMSFHSRR